MPEYYIGLMSGTSIDAIDAVLMDFSVSNIHIVSSFSQPINAQLRDDINALIATRKLPKEYKNVDEQFAIASNAAVTALLKQTSIDTAEIMAIGSHGQTVFHDPNGIPPVSIQIGNPQHIANLSNISTVGNFRQADIDAGGQGAPLACAYHAEVLQDSSNERVVLNLGGIANITKLPKSKNESVIGFDTGPANTLMDAWTQKHLNKAFDQDGNWAKSGKVNIDLLERMLKDSYFAALPPKSTGREHFNANWTQQYLDSYGIAITAEDVQATLLAVTIHNIADSMDAWCPQSKEVLLCGGGSENKYLVSQLEKALEDKTIHTTNNFGVPAEWMEAMAFAWLAKRNIENRPGNIPSVTGAEKPTVLGELHKPA